MVVSQFDCHKDVEILTSQSLKIHEANSIICLNEDLEFPNLLSFQISMVA